MQTKSSYQLNRACCNRTRRDGFKLNQGRFRPDRRKAGETLAQVIQGDGRCPFPGNVPSEIGQVFKQPALAEDAPAHCTEVRLDDL